MHAMLSRLLTLVVVATLAGLAAPPASRAAPQPVAARPDDPSPDPAAPYRSAADRHTLVVPAASVTRALAVSGVQLVADYESFAVVEAPTAVADALVARGEAELRDDYHLILLNTGAIDTTTPQAAALAGPAGTFGGKRMHLVQLAGPVRPEWYDAIVKTGVAVVSAIPQNAYLVYGDAAALAALDQLAQQEPFVRWSGAYRDSYRIQPSLASTPTDRLAVQLFVDPPANAATLALLDALKQGPITRQEILHYINLVVPVDPSAAAQIAARPDVVSIYPYVEPTLGDESQNQIMAGNITGNGPTAGDYLEQLAEWGFTQAQFNASGFVVDVGDSGLDNGTTSPNHFALYVGGTRPGTSRVAYARLQGTPNTDSTIQGRDGHGTINTHIVAGYVPTGAPYDAFPHADASGLRYGLGVAPFVRVGSSVFFDPSSFTDPDYADSHSEAYQDGARISTNSWGADAGGAYTTDAQAYDALVRDAQPSGSTFATPGNQEMVTIFSAGNAGSALNTTGTPGTGKNVLTIGASEGVQPFGGADGCLTPDSEADSYNDMATFSSRGPTDDGRQKPDLVAPGTHITGGVFQTASPGANGTADPGFDGEGVCGGTSGSLFFPAGQQWYTASTGTSHSTPAVAGGAALLRQHFINLGLTPPSPAMTKAYLVNAARHLTGVSANDTLPSPHQGMGLVDLGRAFADTPRILRDQLPANTFTATGQQRSITGVVVDPAQPLRVTLAWTDAPGPTSGSAYLNNLDLTVTVGSTTYRGNVFAGGTSTTGGASDVRNNLESVFLPAGLAAGTPFSVHIRAANIVADGVPNSGGPLDQDFALVVTNANETTLPAIAVESVELTAEGFVPANGALDPGETVTVALTLANTGTGATGNVSAALLAGGGVTAPSAAQSFGVLPPDGSQVTRSFQFRVDPGLACGSVVTVSFQIQDGSGTPFTATADLPVGAFVPESTVPGANSAAVTIPPVGNATLYPSSITIAGASGQIAKVTVTLSGLSHTFPDDLDILLVAPGGQSVVLMSDAGGGIDVSGINLTFDDDAPSSIADGSPLGGGTYKPHDYSGTGTETYGAPAPAGPYGTTLAALDGGSPNGTWSLYVVDDEVPDGGSISGGWSLSISTEVLTCAGAGISATPAEGITTREGGTATISVVLNQEPTSDVTIGVSSSDTTEATVAPASLTFTPANWYIPQTVTVTSVFDGRVDGDVAYTVVLAPAVSGDPAYSGLDPADVPGVNRDSYLSFLPIALR